MMMAAYAAQALYGEYDEDVHKPGFLAIEDFIPQRVSDVHTYICTVCTYICAYRNQYVLYNVHIRTYVVCVHAYVLL